MHSNTLSQGEFVMLKPDRFKYGVATDEQMEAAFTVFACLCAAFVLAAVFFLVMVCTR
jgi:hypothetical protein